jgi:enterochelin esterase-like enzyme
MKKVVETHKLFNLIMVILLYGCGTDQTLGPSPLQEGCTSPGTVISADLPALASGSSYSYRVYLPPCYSAESDSRYPILYLVPGRSSGPGTWFAAGLTDVVDRMILNEEIPPFIIVTTENIDDDPMVETIYTELIPAIEEQYPVIGDKKYRAVAGGSLGGIAAYRLAFQHPDIFSSAGIFGAGAISGEETHIKEWLASINEENSIRVFMDTGDEDPLMLERAEVMKSMLDDVGIENALHTGHGGHNYAYWVGSFAIYLKWLARDW